MPLNEILKEDYNSKYESAKVKPEYRTEVESIVLKIAAARDRYEAVQAQTGIPWFLVGTIHQMECGDRKRPFDCHLYNGDPLTHKTIHEPPGRPLVWPPADPKADLWVTSAVDSLRYQGFDVWRDWTPAGTLYKVELWNGWGYRKRGVANPYLWSYTQHYRKGKYIEIKAKDSNRYVSVYDPDLVSKQPGVVAILKKGEERGLVWFDGVVK